MANEKEPEDLRADSLAWLREIREAHAEILKGATVEEEIRFYHEGAARVHERLGLEPIVEPPPSSRRRFRRMLNATRSTQHIDAPRAAVYRALLDAEAVVRWMVPAGMTSEVHAFDAREGGAFRISLTYDAAGGTGKTTAHTDTYHGTFVKLVPNERVVEVLEFETEDDAMRGEMTITFTLSDADGGTELVAVHDRLPPGLSPADNETGWRMSLAKLAALVEAGY
jgi:uncharacterized protein YndB with AHSA1/START domain